MHDTYPKRMQTVLSRILQTTKGTKVRNLARKVNRLMKKRLQKAKQASRYIYNAKKQKSKQVNKQIIVQGRLC
jgi:shikimate kinase